jgi:hypothetical protein
MSKASATDVFSKIIAELQKLEEDERVRTLSATLAFFGQSELAPRSVEIGKERKRPAGTASAFFDQKQPKTKLEELAVAAKYREEIEGADASSQEQLRAVFNDARRHFDAGNFRRDIENARGRGLFLRGSARNEFQLSSSGQKIVDALPDRKAIKDIGGGRKRTKAKKL